MLSAILLVAATAATIIYLCHSPKEAKKPPKLSVSLPDTRPKPAFPPATDLLAPETAAPTCERLLSASAPIPTTASRLQALPNVANRFDRRGPNFASSCSLATFPFDHTLTSLPVNPTISNRIALEEDQQVEFKERKSQKLDGPACVQFRSYFQKYVCAFLNSNGGLLLLGVTDGGTLSGIAATDHELDNLKLLFDRAARQSFSPPLSQHDYRVSIYRIPKPNRYVIGVHVVSRPHNDTTVYKVLDNRSGTAYARFSASTHVLSEAEAANPRQRPCLTPHSCSIPVNSGISFKGVNINVESLFQEHSKSKKQSENENTENLPPTNVSAAETIISSAKAPLCAVKPKNSAQTAKPVPKEKNISKKQQKTKKKPVAASKPPSSPQTKNNNNNNQEASNQNTKKAIRDSKREERATKKASKAKPQP